jgi:hypothetical protein
MNIGILKILDFQARAKRRRDELWYNVSMKLWCAINTVEMFEFFQK